MVMAELATIPDGKRKGPLITDERTGLPYRYDVWGAGWRRDRKAADISPQVWNRDLRAGGLTEGDLAGASIDDRSKIAGHANKRITARVYDRNTLEAHRRQAAARRLHRGKGAGQDSVTPERAGNIPRNARGMRHLNNCQGSFNRNARLTVR